MKKQKPITITIEPTLSERLNDHPALEWATQNSKNLIWILLFTLALGFFAYRTLTSWSKQSGQNYLAAENAYLEMRSTSGERSTEAADRLSLLLAQQPDLQAKYDGLLAQYLLIQGDAPAAESAATRALARTKAENGPYFQQYAQATLLIANSNYKEALAEARKLQEAIVADRDLTYSALLPLNLLRIAMLQQKLELDADEITSWLQWQDLAKEEGKAVYFERVADVYQEGDIDLFGYISHRINVLK